jgi:restriction endonuclease S subunit
MDQTVINATTEFFQTQITERDEKINSLQEHIQKVTQRSYTEAAERSRIASEMQEWTLEELENNGITESQAEEISSICGFELTKEFELEVTVNYVITVNARDEESAQNAIHDIDFDTVSYNDEYITYLTSNVERVDI